MLKLKPNCEYCDKDLPPSALDARMCSYECTFCADCAEKHLHNVCPNCGGGFTARPIRPAKERRLGAGLPRHPASGDRIHLKWPKADVAAFVALHKDVPPEKR